MELSFKQTWKGDKRELGVVYYCNFRLLFPDKDEWTQCEPFVKGIRRYVMRDLQLPHQWQEYRHEIMKSLLSKKRAEVKDLNGVWLQIWISTDPVPYKWGPKLNKRR